MLDEVVCMVFLKLVVVKWLWFSVTVRVKARNKKWVSIPSLFSILKSDKHLCLTLLAYWSDICHYMM